MGRHPGSHRDRPLPAAVGPREAPQVPVRRDLLRQGRVVAAPPRLRTDLRRERQRAHPRRADGRPVDRDPQHGGPPRGRQVADRSGRGRLRDDPVRVADLLGHRRGPDGAGDGPARAEGDPVHLARSGRRRADLLRRSAPRALPTGAARPLPRLLRAVRGQLHGRRPRLGACADGAGPPAGIAAGSGIVGAAPAVASVAPGHGHLLGARGRDQVVSTVPAGGLRVAHVALGLRRPPLLRRTSRALEVRGHRRPSGPWLRGAGAAAGLRRQLDRLAAARGRLRKSALRHPVRALLGKLPGQGRPRSNAARSRETHAARRHKAG